MKKLTLKNTKREVLLALAYPFFVIVLIPLNLLPKALRKKLGHFLGKRAHKFNKKSFNTTISNLKTAFGKDKSDEEIMQMAKLTFENATKSGLDFFATALCTKRQFFNMVEVEGQEHLDKAYKSGKGVICMVPHLSSWELSAVMPPMLGYETSAASKPIKGRLFNKTIIWFRERRGMKNIARDHSYQHLIDVLHKGECLVMMADQDTKVKGVFIDFFGKQAYTPLGLARLALDTGCALVPMAMTRKPDNEYRFIIYPELKTIDTGDYEKDCLTNTKIQSEVYENIIREFPTQWVWMHRRWKTTPESLAAFLEQKRKQK